MQAEAKIAVVYAEALLDLAKQESKVELVGKQLEDFTDMVLADKRAWRFFSSPVIATEDKVQVIEKTLKDSGQIDIHFLYFLCVIVKRYRFNELPLIRELFHKEMDRLLGQRTVRVRSSYLLTEEEKKKLAATLENYFKKKIIISNDVEPELISGLVLYSDDLIVDSSVQGRLKRIKTSLLKHRVAGEKFYEN